MTTPTRHPLAWPAGRPRTKGRRIGAFQMKDEAETRYAGRKAIDMRTALRRLDYELDRMRAKNVVLSTGYEVRLDGSLILNQGAPADPGVVVYFTLDGKPINLPCDTFTSTVQNVAALAAHLEAVRAIERYGVATGSETLQAFQALPPPAAGSAASTIALGGLSWRKVLNFGDDGRPSEEEVRRRFKSLLIDAGGAAAPEARLRELNLARDAALEELKA